MGTGCVVGILSGLLGIGGGILMVPFLYLLMAGPGWSGVHVPPDHQTALAHATSLAVILPTALSGLRSYRREGVADWDVILPLGMPAALAAVAGALLAVQLPSPLLRSLFAVLLLAFCVRLFRRERPAAGGRERESGSGVALAPAVAGGSAVGLMSALLGIGGGIVAIPILLGWVGLEVRKVAAASIGIVAFAAPAGILAYIFAGRGLEGLPPGTLGYVSVPLALALIPGAVFFAPLGTRLNQRLPVPVLRRGFGLLMLVVGIRLLWTNLPEVAWLQGL